MTRLVARWLVLATLTVVAVGCDDGNGLGKICVLDSDCVEGLVCIEGMCHAVCKEARDCHAYGPDFQCVEGPLGKPVCEKHKSCMPEVCSFPLVCADDHICRTPCRESSDCFNQQFCWQGTCVDVAEPAPVSVTGASGAGGMAGANGGAGGTTGAGGTATGGTGGGSAGAGGTASGGAGAGSAGTGGSSGGAAGMGAAGGVAGSGAAAGRGGTGGGAAGAGGGAAGVAGTGGRGGAAGAAGAGGASAGTSGTGGGPGGAGGAGAAGRGGVGGSAAGGSGGSAGGGTQFDGGADALANAVTLLSSFASPGTLTEGLTYANGHLWISDNSSTLFETSTTGDVLQAISSPDPTPQGMTFDGTSYWIFTTNFGRIYNFTVANPNASVVSWFASKATVFGGGLPNDLAYDGENIWHANQFNLFKMSRTGTLLTTYAFGRNVVGVDWDGERLWICYADSTGRTVLSALDGTGKITSTFNSPVAGIQSISWAPGDRLWGFTEGLGTGGSRVYELDMSQARALVR